jgi:hypothetical protein
MTRGGGGNVPVPWGAWRTFRRVAPQQEDSQR